MHIACSIMLKPATFQNHWTARSSKFETTNAEIYPADCRKIAAVDSHNSIAIERKENINTIDFCIKTFLSAIYFDVIS